MKRCPKCFGSIRRMGHIEKPFYCPKCKEWFSDEEATPKLTNADRIRQMSDEELAMWINDMTTNAFSVLTLGSDKPTKSIFYWLNWLEQEAE